MSLDQLKARLIALYQDADQRSRGSLSILRQAVERFNHVRGAEAAASIAYYALFSLFPLLLTMVAVLGFVLVNVEAPEKVLEFIAQVLPIARQLISDNLLQILERRGAGGIIGLVGLLWAASGVFLTLSRNINQAWPTASVRNLLQGRLLALAMVTILALALIVSVVVNTILSLLPLFEIPIQGGVSIYDTLIWRLGTNLFAWLTAFFIFLILYYWVPNTKVRWREAFWGALLAASAWQITARAFSWYLRSGLIQLEAFYGSLGTIIVLLTWIYLMALITLFGAHLSASVATHTRIKPAAEKEQQAEDSPP